MKRLTLVLTLLCVLAVPAVAAAAKDQESTFQDDNELIYTTSKHRDKVLDELKRLGVDRIRVTVIWRAITKNPKAKKVPTPFNPTDPADYPPGIWDNYDQLVEGAADRGIEVNFNITGPIPRWGAKKAPRSDIQDTYEPDLTQWYAFVLAVARRYDGTYPAPGDYGGTLPRVDYWSIWNEPNHSGWLTPTWDKEDGKGPFFPRSAAIYRGLVNAAWFALGQRGHTTKTDTIIFGETAPSGTDDRDIKRFMKPLVFIRAMYCLDQRNRRLSGKAAERLDCPKTGKEFVTKNPALFDATGFAHHPYAGLTAPNLGSPKDTVVIGNLKRLERVLDVAQRRYGQRRKLPLYLTEFGYETRPDRSSVPPKLQAKFINQSEYIAYRNPRVKTISQYLLLDNGGDIGLTFQTGLIFRAGNRKKPSFDAYRIPLWVHGSKFWGVLRPAKNGKRVRGLLQFRRDGGKWETIEKVRSRGEHNTVIGGFNLSTAGDLRLKYKRDVSRTVPYTP